MIVFSGDIGGTTTRMQLTEFITPNERKIIKHARYKNSDYSSFTEVIADFFIGTHLGKHEITAACFGVAGPVVDDTVQFTNLPWLIKTSDIKQKLNLDQVALLNDFVAIGYGLETLQPQDLLSLQIGQPSPGGVKAYLGAGTGLGVGFMVYNQNSYQVYPTEGGHIDFAPTDEEQIELLTFLRQKHHRVSFERVLSGQGLVNIYNFIRVLKNFVGQENLQLKTLIANNNHVDAAAIIAEYAIKQHDLLATRALNIFVRVYGAAAGNLALTTLPYGGLYIVGGIAPKLLSQIQNHIFLDAFSDKGRMTNLIKEIPVYVVLDPDVGLQGAAMYASKLVPMN